MNYLALLVAGISNMVVGFIWYGPLFGKMWMKLNKMEMGKMKMDAMTQVKMYVPTYIAALVMAYTLSWAMTTTGMTSVTAGVKLAVMLWFGFIVTVKLADTIFGGKQLKAYLLDIAYWLVTLVIMGVILGVWH